MKYSDYIHESEINHKSLSYNLITPKAKKGKITQASEKIEYLL